MSFVPYLLDSEADSYGVPLATHQQINAACKLINGFIGRPEGLLYSLDANGAPAYMTNMLPSLSYALGSLIPPGAGIVVTLPGTFGRWTIGEAIVLDRANPSLTEVCIVTAATANTVTLANVQFSHAQGSFAEFGMTILDEVRLSRGNPSIRTSRFPLVQILSGNSKYGIAKLPPQITDMSLGDGLLLTSVMSSSIPYSWSQLDTTQWDINYKTGAVTIYPYTLSSGAVDIRLRYIAGFTVSNLPLDIKQAVANIIRFECETPFSSNIKSLKAGDSAMERFSPTLLDADTKALLQPYKLMRIG